MKKIDEVHMNKITPPSNMKRPRWMTNVLLEDGTRKKITSTTEEGLIDKLYNFYFSTPTPTVKELFDLWIEKRKSENISVKSIRRYINFWDKYYANNSISSNSVNRLTTNKVEDFYHKMIIEYKMTLKELNNMKLVLSGIMKLALRVGYIRKNPFDDAEIKTYACYPPSKKSTRYLVYNPLEKEKLFKQLNCDLELNPMVTDSFGIFLLFKLGLRVGELAAIRDCDIDYCNKELHVHRMESVEEINGKLVPVVVDYTKKKSQYGDRYLPLSDYEISIFQRVKEINELYGYKDIDFVFVDEDGRTKIREFDYRIRKLCNKAGIPEKSSHDIRRTVASELFANNVNIEIIRGYLGHSDVKTTYQYIYDANSEERTKNILKTSLSSMNGLSF